MYKKASELAEEWDQTGVMQIGQRSYISIYKTIDFFSKRQYFQYLPTQGSRHPDFLDRLDQWIANVDDVDDKKVLFEFAPEIIFFGRDEFAKLYQAALHGPITRWIVEKLNLTLTSPDLQDRVNEELTEATWFCPLTDSMPISDFHHINDLGSVEYRPDFFSLSRFGDPQRVLSFMINPPSGSSTLRRIVILEDFVGAGTQITDALEFAASIDPQVEILFVPLIICPEGVKSARRIANSLHNLRYEAVIELPDESFVNSTTNFPPGSIEGKVKELANKIYPRVTGNGASYPRPYDPFGCWGTGSVVVMYSNTPANTLPLVQHESNTWKPLFRRSARVR